MALQPKLIYPTKEYRGGCAHEDSPRTVVSEDLCHVRSANPRRAPKCAGCKSPFRAKVMYKADRDIAEPLVADTVPFERAMAAKLLEESQSRRMKDDVETDDEDLEQDDEDTSGDFGADDSAGDDVGAKGGRGPMPMLTGEKLLEMADRAAALKKSVQSVPAICKALGGMKEPRYYDLVRCAGLAPEFRALIKEYNLTLSAIFLIANFPDATHASICELLSTRRLTLKILESIYRETKFQGGDLRELSMKYGIPWPASIDVGGEQIAN